MTLAQGQSWWNASAGQGNATTPTMVSQYIAQGSQIEVKPSVGAIFYSWIVANLSTNGENVEIEVNGSENTLLLPPNCSVSYGNGELPAYSVVIINSNISGSGDAYVTGSFTSSHS